MMNGSITMTSRHRIHIILFYNSQQAVEKLDIQYYGKLFFYTT